MNDIWLTAQNKISNQYLESPYVKPPNSIKWGQIIELAPLQNSLHVKLPKYTRLGKCDLCLMLKDIKSKAITEEERLQVQQEIILHNANQMNERIQYKQRCLKAGIFSAHTKPDWCRTISYWLLIHHYRWNEHCSLSCFHSNT